MMKKRHNCFKMLLVVELLIVLMLFGASFGGEEQIFSFNGKGIQELVERAEGYAEFNSDRMRLAPGVYRIKVQSNLAEGQSMHIEMQCDSSYYRALRGNGITVYTGSELIEFDVYVADTVPSAYIQCVFYGSDTEALVQLEVNKTDLGKRILSFVLLLVFTAVDFMVCFRRWILEGKVNHKQQVVFWTMAAGVLLAYFPYFTTYFFMGENTAYYLQQIAGIRESLMQGTWLQEQGITGWFASGELFLLIPALFQVIGFSIMSVFKIFVFLVMAVTAVITYHSLKKCVKEEYAALMGSMLYLLMPYHISGIYIRGDVGEFAAMCFLPLIICGIYLLITENVVWYSICGLAALALSEPVHAGAVAAGGVSLIVAFFLHRMLEKYGDRVWAAGGAAGTMFLLWVVSIVNEMAFAATPIYLYDVKNLGIAGIRSGEQAEYQKTVLLFLVSLAVILGIYLYRKKRIQDGNENRSKK